MLAEFTESHNAPPNGFRYRLISVSRRCQQFLICYFIETEIPTNWLSMDFIHFIYFHLLRIFNNNIRNADNQSRHHP